MANKIEEGLKKSLFAVLGLASVTKEKAEHIAKELIKRGEMSRGDVSKIANILLEKTKTGKNAIEKGLTKIAKKIMEKMDMPTKKDINSLKKMVADLEEKLKKIKK